METCSAAIRAISQLKQEKVKSPAAPKCGRNTNVAETTTIAKGTAAAPKKKFEVSATAVKTTKKDEVATTAVETTKKR
jgi:hypothetical protein